MPKARQINRIISFLRNQDIDIRVRMLYLMEFSTLAACILGTIAMISFASSLLVLTPNFVMIIFCIVGIYFTHIKKMYDFASMLIIIGCAYFTMPLMYFTAGGSNSGMPFWLVFGIVFSCMMAKGKARIILPGIGIAILSVCIVIGYIFPETIIPLESEAEAFLDFLQSFIIVCIILCGCIMVYLKTYEKQRNLLEIQRNELRRLTNMDALTGIFNRRAYYEDTAKYREGESQENVVVVSLDLNGLKRINDNFGHDAGDAFIRAASNIMNRALSPYGTIYRTGGDEFIAVLNCTDSEADSINKLLEDAKSSSPDKWAKDLVIAVGIVGWNQNRELSFSELEKIADQRMYKNKSDYYRNSGIDRRKR